MWYHPEQELLPMEPGGIALNTNDNLSNVSVEKPSYETPRLTSLGSIQDLVQIGGGGGSDLGTDADRGPMV